MGRVTHHAVEQLLASNRPILLPALGPQDLSKKDRDAIEAVESDLNSMVSRDDISLHDRAKIIKLLRS
jgi:hypothetical protein